MNPPLIQAIVDLVRERHGPDYRGHDASRLEQRLIQASRAGGLDGLERLLELARAESSWLERARLALVTPAPWFTAPEAHRALRDHVIPVFRTYASVLVWIPACGTGELAYEMAIALREEGVASRCRIYATEACDVALGVARRGRYPLSKIAAAKRGYQDAGGRSTLDEYFTSEGQEALIRPVLRDRIVFLQHDLTADGSLNEFQLILLRDLLDELGEPLRERVAALVDESLRRFGIVGASAEPTSLKRSASGYERLATPGVFLRKAS